MFVGLLFFSLLGPGRAHQAKEIESLIQRLGDRRFTEREAASIQLEAIGRPAITALRQAASANKDPEIRRRAGQLLRVCGKLQAVEGIYHLGVGTLEIQGDGEFYAAYCVGMKDMQGTASLESGWLVLTPRALAPKSMAPPRPLTYLPVKWGTRTYLLAKDEFLEFCNAINQKTEPRHKANGLFFLRRGDWVHDVQGFPALPGDWANYLLPKPVQAEVIAMVDDRTGKLNVGKAQGIRPGMILLSGQNNRYPCQVRVVAVEKDTCLIREVSALIVPDIKVGDKAGSQPIPKKDDPNSGVIDTMKRY
jgi:hypothetical protein